MEFVGSEARSRTADDNVGGAAPIDREPVSVLRKCIRFAEFV